MRAVLRISERRACRVLTQARTTQCRELRARDDQEALVAQVCAIASSFGRYGYKTVTGMLQQEGWRVGKNRVSGI